MMTPEEVDRENVSLEELQAAAEILDMKVKPGTHIKDHVELYREILKAHELLKDLRRKYRFDLQDRDKIRKILKEEIPGQ